LMVVMHFALILSARVKRQASTSGIETAEDGDIRYDRFSRADKSSRVALGFTTVAVAGLSLIHVFLIWQLLAFWLRLDWAMSDEIALMFATAQSFKVGALSGAPISLRPWVDIWWILFIIALTSPTSLLITVRVIKWFNSQIAGNVSWHSRKARIADDKSEKLRDLAETFNVKCPRLIVAASEIPRISTRVNLWSSSGQLYLSSLMFQLFSEEELEAALAHELVHLKRDIWPIRILIIISRLTAIPQGFFTLLYDFETSELRADRETIKVGVDPKALKSAIVKLSTGGLWRDREAASSHQSKRVRFAWLRRGLVNFKSTYYLFFSDYFLGYTHPLLQARLRYLDSLTERKGGVQRA